MSGFGLFPFGLGPFGGLGPSGSLVLTGSGLAPRAATARLLVDGNYVLGSDGRLAETDEPLLQEAAIRLGTIRGSIVGVPTLGSAVVQIESFTDASVVQIRREVELALQPMVDRGDIRDVLCVPSPYVRDGTAVARYSVSFSRTGRIRT